ncbi:MAG: Rieske 2Fe-2S domain-containing protein [Planctomycetaceae bacterium]|nr:Rieske 2Fe-2S domain-containing protein [Planctomycetaceae bacterium]
MGCMDHWHPVLAAKNLRQKPVGVRLNGRELVLFRDGRGQIGALDDCCVHRRMRLSLGSVSGGRLHCMYHGWSYDSQGNGESPATPKMYACAPHYDVCEKYDWLWVKPTDARAEFPALDVAGFEFAGTLYHEMEAPLEIVLDNFTEVEHTPTTHALLGYSIDRMPEVETKVESTANSVRVFNAGPQKAISPVVAAVFGIHTGDRFVDDWTTYFSPVYTVYDQYWNDEKTGAEKGIRWRNVVFFNPLDAERTGLVTFAFYKPDPQGGWRNWLTFKPGLLWFVDREIRLDQEMVSKLADKSPSIEGMKLSRFDRVLGLNRARLASVYRGTPAATDLVGQGSP